MTKFFLHRIEDETGVSGVGAVAEGVIFHDGKVALCWRTRYRSIAIYDSISDLEQIHGHHGKSQIVYADADDGKGNRLLQEI